MRKKMERGMGRKRGGFEFCFPREYISENDSRRR